MRRFKKHPSSYLHHSSLQIRVHPFVRNVPPDRAEFPSLKDECVEEYEREAELFESPRSRTRFVLFILKQEGERPGAGRCLKGKDISKLDCLCSFIHIRYNHESSPSTQLISTTNGRQTSKSVSILSQVASIARSKYLEVVKNPHEVSSQPPWWFVGNLDAILKHSDREARARA